MASILIPADNNLICFGSATGSMIWRKTYESKIKDAQFSPDEKNIIVLFESKKLIFCNSSGVFLNPVLNENVEYARFLEETRILVRTKTSLEIRDTKGILVKKLRSL